MGFKVRCSEGDEVKTIALGVDPSEMADMRECKTFEEHRPCSQFEVNEGKKRIVLGSTDTMVWGELSEASEVDHPR